MHLSYCSLPLSHQYQKFFFHQQYSDIIMSVMGSQITSLTIVYSTVYSSTDQRKHQSSTSLAFVKGIHRWPMNSRHKGPVMWKMFHLMPSLWNAIEGCTLSVLCCVCYGLIVSSVTHIIQGHFSGTGAIIWWLETIQNIMTSSNGNIICITGPLWGESTSHHMDSPHKGQWHRVLMFSLICTWTNGWANNWDSSDLKHHHIHYDVTVMRARVITPHRSINSYYLNHNKAKHGKTYTVYFMEYDGFDNNIPTPGGCWILIKWTAPNQRSMPWGTYIFLEDCKVILKISVTGHFMSNSLLGPDSI